MTDRPPRVAQFHHRRHRRKTLCNQDCAVRERLDASVPRTLFRLRVLATCYQHTQYPAIYLLYSELLSRVAGGRDVQQGLQGSQARGSPPSTTSPVICLPALDEELLMLMVSWGNS